MLTLLGIIAGTLLAEDAACVAAGALVAQGQVGLIPAMSACAFGIWIGDVGLWAIGNAAGQLGRFWPWLSGKLPAARQARLSTWLVEHPRTAVLSSRFLPGTRFPVYVMAGFVGLPIRRFAATAAAAAAVWAPIPVVVSAAAGTLAGRIPGTGFLPAWAPPLMTGTALLAAWLAWPRFRRGTPADHRAWEFWPSWLFYLPVAAWVALLAIRYRGFGTIAAANPGIPDGGIVGESKFQILAGLPPEWTIPTAFIDSGELGERVGLAHRCLNDRGWSFPLVLKPDVGQRGDGVRIVRTPAEVAAYLGEIPRPVLVQPFHEGPYEAGVFYYRFPSWSRGRILSITDKQFPEVVGNGRSTLAELLHAHPRFRRQLALFLERHRSSAQRVLGAGERFPLTLIGNHAQGAIFYDGSHLATAALEERIDQIARAYPGFYVGRFDVRYRDVEAFKAGRDMAIVELNGATAEPTDAYDPTRSLWNAYRGLFRQWSIVFAIGYANRRAGRATVSVRRLMRLVRAHLTSTPLKVHAD